MALGEDSIAQPHLANQKVAKRRRGRPRRWERDKGSIPLTIMLPAALHVALEMLASNERPMLVKRVPSMRGTDYAADQMLVLIADRFMDVFHIPVGAFLTKLSFALDSGIAPQFAVARVLADVRAGGGVQ